MSKEPANKKRKVGDEEADQTEIQSYVDLCTGGMSIIKGKAEFIKGIKSDIKLVSQLFEAVYIPNVSAPGVFVMPDAENVLKTRDEKGVIIKLHSEEKLKLSGTSLQRLGGAYLYRTKGYNALIWSNNGGDCLSAVSMPECNVEKEERNHPLKEQERLTVYRIFFNGNTHKLYLSVKDFAEVISAKEVEVQHMKGIFIAMNNIAKSEPDAVFLKPNLDMIVTAIKGESTRAWSSYYQVLLGVFMQQSTLDERVNAFLTHGPTLTLATVLKIPKPEQQRLVGADLKELPKVKLSDMDDSDELLLSDMILPANLYNTVRSTALTVLAKPDGAFGKKLNNKLREQKNVATMKAGQLKAIISVIVASRAKEKLDENPKPELNKSQESVDDMDNFEF